MYLTEMMPDRRGFDFEHYRARVYVRAKNKHLKFPKPTDNEIYKGIAVAVHDTLDDSHLRLNGAVRERVMKHLRDNAAGWIAEYRSLMPKV